jgi:predicted alpha-1,2-mannosidase
MKTSLIGSLAAALTVAALAREPVDEVNPFIGAVTQSKVRHSGSQGKTFPGAATPYGLVQLSPDSVTGGDNGSGYNFEHTTLQGFSFTHMSGVGWYGDLGNFLVTPTTGPLRTSYGEVDRPGTGYLSRKADETASAGYYAVTLVDHRVRAELTAAPHSGLLRFTYPQDEHARIQIDLARRVGGTAVQESVKVVGENAIEGWMRCTAEGGGWGNGGGRPNYTVYFHAEFSRPLKDFGVWSVDIPDGAKRRHQQFDPEFLKAMSGAKVLPGCREQGGKHLGFYAEFPTRAGEQLLLKAGLSFVSLAGARDNLRAEIPGWDFDGVRAAARAQWARELSRITIEGGTADQRIAFYTALYHAMLDPRAFADLDGSYPGGDGQPHKTDQYTRRTIFSGWDVYRSAYPLMTLIAPKVVTDMVNSLSDLAVESKKGYLERWEFLNAYSGCMNGNPAVPVLVDAYQKGLRGFDVAQAYDLARQTCERCGNGKLGYAPGRLSDTMEQGLDEWCLSELAAALGKKDDAKLFHERALAYRQVFNPVTGWFGPKDAKGQFVPQPKGSLDAVGCVECNALQQGWFVPHDVPGLIALLGGKEKFVSRLNEFFAKTPDVTRWNDYYNHANEPVHLIPFLFNRAGAPWLTQKWVRFICEKAYGSDVYGLCGDEDVGQMSSWFVLAASGLHQACPGNTRYELFTPLFDQVQIRIDPMYGAGKSFSIVAHHNGPGPRYIQAAKLNGQPLDRCWLDHKEIVAGGVLELELGAEPNKSWGCGAP